MIILIGGRAGEGKTTFANFCSKILEKQSVSSVTVPFARMVKETASFMGWNGKKDDKGRKLLQDIGSIGREYNLDIWADHVVDFITGLPVPFVIVFIDDWRFPNEAKVIRKHFFPVVTVRIVRPVEFHTLRGTPMYNEVSEISLPEEESYYDFVINNNKDLKDLEDKVKFFVEKILLKRGKND